MSDKYKIRDNDKAYFVTLTIIDWIDVFTRKEQKFFPLRCPAQLKLQGLQGQIQTFHLYQNRYFNRQ